MLMRFLQGAMLENMERGVGKRNQAMPCDVDVPGNKVCCEVVISPAILSLSFGVMWAWTWSLVAVK
jgi:hypothetical protein